MIQGSDSKPDDDEKKKGKKEEAPKAQPRNLSLSVSPELKAAMKKLARENGVTLNQYLIALMRTAEVERPAVDIMTRRN